MALTVNVVFDQAQDAIDGNGFLVASWDDALDDPIQTVNHYATWTAAAAAIKALFQTDAGLSAYFQDKAEAQVLAAHAAEVTTDKAAFYTADGL